MAVRSVSGMRLSGRPGCWSTPDGRWVFVFDEHERSWSVEPVDLDPAVALVEQVERVRTLRAAVRLVRSREVVA